MRCSRGAVRVATVEETLYYGRDLPRGLIPAIGGYAPGLVKPRADNLVANFSGTGASPISVTSSAAVPVGGFLVVRGVTAGAATAQAITDSVANTYTQSTILNSGSPVSVVLSAANPTTALTTSSTFTYTVTGGTPTGGNGVAGTSFVGVSPTAAANVYATQKAVGTGTSFSITTSASVVKGDLVVGVLWFASGTISGTGAWGGGTGGVYFQVASATQTYTFTATSTVSSSYSAVVAAYPALRQGQFLMAGQAVQLASVR